MMVRKQVLCEERTRQVPAQFSWVDPGCGGMGRVSMAA